MTLARQKWGHLPVLVLLVLLALALRLYGLASSPLRGDEAFAIQYWAAPWPEALTIAAWEPHPLGTFAMFGLWKGLLGETEWAMRLLPTLTNVVGVAAIYAAGKSLFRNQRAALLAALLYTINPFLIWHSQDARNYATWAAVDVIALVAFVIALKRNRRQDWALYAIATAMSAYVFLFAPLFTAAQALYLLLFKRDLWRRWLTSMLGAGILLIPWLLQAYSLATSGYSGTAGGFDLSQLVSSFLPALTVGETLPWTWMTSLWILLIPITCGAIAAVWRRRPHSGALLASSLLVPVLLLVLVSTRMSIFRPRYVIPLTNYLMLLIAYLAAALTTSSKLAKRSGFIMLLFLAALNGTSLLNHYHDPAYAKAPDWRGLGVFLTSHTAPGDLVVQQVLDPAFTYYFLGPADETTLPVRANAPAYETIAVLSDAIDQRRSVWLIGGNVAGYDDERVTETWLNSEAQTAASLNIAGFEVQEFRDWVPKPAEYSKRLGISVGDASVLLDWQAETLGPDTLRVLLYWQAVRQTDRPLKGFVHLFGPPRVEDGSPLWTQDDHLVGRFDTTQWLPGDIVRDVYQLPLPGKLPHDADWTLRIGLYDPETMDRLPVDNNDYVEVGVSLPQ